VIMLATLGRVWVGIDERVRAGKVGSDEVWGTDAELGGWGGAGVIPSISPTCSGAAMKPSSAHSHAAGAVDWHACLRLVLVGDAGWP
jgi:hypothetical protein